MKTGVLLSIVVFMILANGAAVIAQDSKEVSGMVTTYRNYPLEKVNVTSEKTGEMALTDSTGRFSIRTMRGDRLIITASGFERKVIEVRKKNVYVADLVFFDTEANFTRATSEGHISPEDLRRAISGSISAGKDYSKYTSIYDLVGSEVYDVRVNGKSITSTRKRSFDSAPPVLLVVDNKIVPDISYIDPSWVRSIELVDDVRASMFGSMGANGVLMITLK